MVRIRRSHRRGRGSIPRLGSFFYFPYAVHFYLFTIISNCGRPLLFTIISNCGRPLVRLRHERINSYPHRATPSNDNNPGTAPIGAFGHITTSKPGIQVINILASTPPSSWRRRRGRPPLRWADQIIKVTQMSLSDAVIAIHDRPSLSSLVRDASCPTTQALRWSAHSWSLLTST